MLSRWLNQVDHHIIFALLLLDRYKQQASGKMAGLVPREGGMGYSLTVYKNRACRFSKTVTHLLYMTPGYLCQNMQINRMRVQG